jgi:hypothetical protein
MWAAVRPGGVLVVEDADFDGWCCYPANEGFDFFLRTYGQVVAHWGGDHAMGRKLYRYCLDAGIPQLNVNVVQPLYIEGDGKSLPWSTLEASRDAILDAGIASADEVDVALEKLAAIANDPRNLISGPRIFQVWSRQETDHGFGCEEHRYHGIRGNRSGSWQAGTGQQRSVTTPPTPNAKQAVPPSAPSPSPRPCRRTRGSGV